jgi:hypothetical protein
MISGCLCDKVIRLPLTWPDMGASQASFANEPSGRMVTAQLAVLFAKPKP